MKKSFISKFLLGVMSLSMVFSVVGNNTAKAGGFDCLTEMLCQRPYDRLTSPDLSSEEAEDYVRDIISNLGVVDDGVATVVLKRFFDRFPNLINIGTEEYGAFINALSWFVRRNNTVMVKWLIEHGAAWVVKDKCGVYMEDSAAMYRCAFEKAKETGDWSVVNCLLKHGYDGNCDSKPMDPAQINPPKVAKSKSGFKARFRKMLGCFRSR